MVLYAVIKLKKKSQKHLFYKIYLFKTAHILASGEEIERGGSRAPWDAVLEAA